MHALPVCHIRGRVRTARGGGEAATGHTPARESLSVGQGPAARRGSPKNLTLTQRQPL